MLGSSSSKPLSPQVPPGPPPRSATSICPQSWLREPSRVTIAPLSPHELLRKPPQRFLGSGRNPGWGQHRGCCRSSPRLPQGLAPEVAPRCPAPPHKARLGGSGQPRRRLPPRPIPSRPVPSLPRGARGSPGMARPGPARLGSARRGSARRGWAGSGQVGALNRAGPAASGASARAPRRPLHVKSPGAGGRRDPAAGGSPSPSPAPAAGRTPSRGAFRPLAPSGPGARLRALASGRRRSPRGSRLACGAVREGGAGTARWAAGAQTGLKASQCLLLWHSNAHTTPPQGLGLSG